MVEPRGTADHRTIGNAIRVAKAEDRVLVCPGHYREGLVVDKDVESIGDSRPGEVVVEACGRAVLVAKTASGRVANVTLRRTGGGEGFGVEIGQERPELAECDITSQTLGDVAIFGKGVAGLYATDSARSCPSGSGSPSVATAGALVRATTADATA